jgi:hypothetical protein
MVARATITTSSSSFFMAAMVAGRHVRFDGPADRRRAVPHRCVATRPQVAVLVRRLAAAF